MSKPNKAKNNRKKLAGTKTTRVRAVEKSIILSSQLDISKAEELLKLLLSYKNKIQVIDASKVEYMTTPCVQIFLSYAKSMVENKKIFRIKSYSENFKAAFFDLGFGNEFMEWSGCENSA